MMEPASDKALPVLCRLVDRAVADVAFPLDDITPGAAPPLLTDDGVDCRLKRSLPTPIAVSCSAALRRGVLLPASDLTLVTDPLVDGRFASNVKPEGPLTLLLRLPALMGATNTEPGTMGLDGDLGVE